LMMLTLGVAWFGGDVLVRRPANVLLEVTRQLREGDLSARSGLTYGRGEIDQLARAFDEAAESLQRREAQRREADETLRQSEERFRLLVERVKDYAIFMLDPAGRVVSWNAGAELIKGYRAEEIIGQPFSRFYPEEDRQQGKPERELELVREQGRCENRSWRVRQDGSRFFADVVITALRDEQGDLLGFANITRDITELKKAEDSLNLLVSGIEKVAQVRSPQDLAQEICLSVAKAFDFQFVWLGQIYPDGVVRPICRAGNGADYLEEQMEIRSDDSPQGQGPVGRAIRNGVPAVVNDIAAEADFTPWNAIAQEKGYRSVAVFPLNRGREPFGNLSVYSSQTGFFSTDRVRLLSTFAGIAAKFLENARLTDQTERRLNQLTSLNKIDRAMTSSADLRVILDVVVEQVMGLSHLDAAAVLLLNPHANRLEYIAARGLKANQAVHSRVSLADDCLPSRALREHRHIYVPDLNLAETDLINLGELVSQGFVSYLAEPLEAKGKSLGVLEGYSRTPLPLGSDLLEFFAGLAGQAAIAIDHTALSDDLRRSHQDLTLAYDATLEGLARTMELRDYETQGHSERVTEMSVRLAQRLGMSGQELDHLRRGALLHDIGKIGIPDSILLKPGPLDEAQWEVMRQHPEKAFRLLAPIAYLKPALDIPYCHHEKWDGSGYPRGLAGETLKEEAGKHFDPRVVEAFLKILAEEATSA
jgi:PAS domain S-box-containing protein